MKIKTLYFSMALLAASMSVNAQQSTDVTGRCADYIQVYDFYSLQADSIYLIPRTSAEISVDGVAETAWDVADPRVLSKVGRENATNIVNLDNFPQTEAYAHATFKALWTDNGVYMFISVKDNMICYQNAASSQWENDGIEFFFAQVPGASLKQIIIPAMVGLTNPAYSYPAALDFEHGTAHGSQADYSVYGYENSWEEDSLFYWGIRKTTDGWDMEVYMDADIVTRNNRETNFGLDKMFSGEIAYDIAGTNQDGAGLYKRESILNMLGNSNNGYRSSAQFGYFKMVAEPVGIKEPTTSKFNAIYNADSKEIKITSSTLVSSVKVYNVAGQVMPVKYNNATISVSQLKKGIYIVKAKDLAGNSLGVQKVVIY